jgi:hypothetical protein
MRNSLIAHFASRVPLALFLRVLAVNGNSLTSNILNGLFR